MFSWTIIFRARIFRASLAALLLGVASQAHAQIEVQSLDALDPLEVSLPGAALTISLWDGTDAVMAGRVLSRLPGAAGAGYVSTGVAELARSVLSSGGHPPSGGRGNAALPVLRADRLLAAGGVHEAYDLLERTPNLNQNEALSRLHAELAFATGDNRSACHTANALLDGRDQPYWLRTRAFCLALDGQTSAAELTAELARSASADAGYDVLLFAITMDGEAPARLPALDSGLELAMVVELTAGSDLTAMDVSQAPGWLQRHLASRSWVRPEAASDPAAAFAAALTLSGAARTAELESVLVQALDREIAGAALSALLDDAVRVGDFRAAARRYGTEVQTVALTRETLADGYRLTLAALMSGDVRTALAWRDALIDGPPAPPVVWSDPQQKPDDGLDTGLTLDPPAPAEGLPEWQPPSARRMVTLDLAIAIARDRITGDRPAALLDAHFEAQGTAILADVLALNRLGADAAPGLRTALLDLPQATVSPDLLAMEAAMRAGAGAEAAILVVAALNQAGAEPNPETLSRALRTLDVMGLRRAALDLLLGRLVARAV